MNRSSRIAWIKQAGFGIVLVLVASLLTVLFSVLGTITCSALVGMMCGSIRQWKWQVVPVSLVFPTVAMVFLAVSSTNLGLRQQGMVPVLCFGAFWALYGMTYGLVGMEKKNRAGLKPTEPGPGSEEARPSMDSPVKSVDSALEPMLTELQGRWSCENGIAAGDMSRKVIEIVRNQMVMKTLGANGQWCLVSQGPVEVARLGAFKVLNVLSSNPRSSDPSGPAWSWIYRVQGDTLALASHFEDTDTARPTSELYFKQTQ